MRGSWEHLVIEIMYYSSQTSITKYHKLVALSNRNLFSHSSIGTTQQGWCLMGALTLGPLNVDRHLLLYAPVTLFLVHGAVGPERGKEGGGRELTLWCFL